MSETVDFESYWLKKFARCLDETAGPDTRQQVMAGSESLSDQTDRSEVIAWSKAAMERLASLVDEEQARTIMTGCACQYGKENLQPMRQVYAETGDLERVHRMLQEKFEGFLADTLQLGEPLIREIVSRGWGLAGILDGDTIRATKIPKSGFLVEYMNETDPDKKRQVYCHCPRIRDVLETAETLPAVYCYCGAGYYQGIWQEILQQPVEVEVLESVLQGDEVCTIAVHLPATEQS